MAPRTSPVLSRRAFGAHCGNSFLALAFANFLRGTATADDQGLEAIDSWFCTYRELGDRLAAGKLGQAAWQDEMSSLFKEISLPQLMQRIDFERVTSLIKSTVDDKAPELFHTLQLDGRAPRPGAEATRVLISKIAYVKKGRSIPPHGHSNMVSAFLNLSGQFHIRQYDKVKDEGRTMCVRVTEDAVSGPGAWSSISDERNNVHWLTAKSEDCFLFTTKMIEINPNKPVHGRINIDVARGTSLGGNLLEVTKISAAEAAERY